MDIFQAVTTVSLLVIQLVLYQVLIQGWGPLLELGPHNIVGVSREAVCSVEG